MRSLIACTLLIGLTTVAFAWKPKSKAVGRGEKTLELDSDKLTESSGLAFSHVDDECVWSHNDSGGAARLYAFNEKGDCCGRLTLEDVKAVDWEDMASFVDGVPRLIIADVGDNSARRGSVSLYLLDEPNPKKKTKVGSFHHLKVQYADGGRDCESVAVDVANRRILLLSKSPFGGSLHSLPLPGRSEDSVRSKVVATRIGSVPLPMATGMDFDPATGDLWVTSYFQAFCFPAPKPIEERVKELPRGYNLPKLRQIEAIAVDDKSRVWVTSEGSPTKMRRLQVDEIE
ncbi:MAG: hypothetical protein AAFX06_13625 [Planctomycetota bacterium]